MTTTYNSCTIVFFVKDINRTEKFYRTVLGIQLEKISESDEPGAMMAVVNSGLELVFFEHETPVGQTPVVVFGLEDGHIDRIAEEIAQKGVEIVTPVSEAPGGWSVDFYDPDNHLLSFYQTGDLPRR